MGRNKAKIIDLFGSALIALLLGSALSMILLGALGLGVAFGQVLLSACAAALVCALMLVNRPCALAGLFLTVAVLIIWMRAGGFGTLSGLFDALIGLTSGGESDLSSHAPALAMGLSVLLTLIMFWMARMSGGVYPALTLSAILAFGSWFISNQIQPLYAVMAIAALATMFARAADEKTAYLRALPAGLIVALLAIALLPGGRITWQPLEDAAQKARDLFSDYFLFTDPRTTYSISADGFQPMGEILGGPAEPLLDDVMTVKTAKPLLLRGSVKRTYTTYSWTETAVNSRYVFIDPVRRGLRDQVFDADRQPSFVASGAFETKTAGVTMIKAGISALFVPHGLTDYQAPIDLVTYFSTGGEVFITRGVEPGDSYSVSAALPTGDTGAMRELTLQRQGKGDDRYRAAREGYTSLPRGIEQGVYTLSEKLTRDQKNPYDKALAIQNHLMAGYTYSLDVDYPPQGRDFVSYFLLESKTGYCSYFASAMAVLGRMAGLPTRYVEGYMVPVRGSGETVVSGKNAHAWVEVYFEGVGWVTFNPTPGSGDSYEPPSGGGSDSSGLNSHAGDEGDPTRDEAGEPTPAPSPTPPPPGEEEGGAGEEEQGQDTSEDEPEDGPEDPPPDEPEDQPEDPPEDDPESEDEPNDQMDLSFLWWLLLLIPIAGAAYFVVVRLKASDPGRAIGRRVKSEEKLMIWYRALLLALEHQGQAPGAGETPVQFAARLKAAGVTGDAFGEVARQVSLNRYAKRTIDAAAIEQAQTAYRLLRGQFGFMEKTRWLIHRVVKGLGDARQIP